jgi:High potential iron-sulfur protein
MYRLIWENSMSNRREFIIQCSFATGASVAALTTTAAFADAAMVDEKDAQATALGYKADGTKTDKVKFPKYAKEQNCSNCALYQGKADSKAAACPLFAGKQVAAKGWCSAWAK